MATLERELILDHFAARTVSGRIVEELLENVGRLIDRTRAKGLTEYLETAHEIVAFHGDSVSPISCIAVSRSSSRWKTCWPIASSGCW